MNKIRLQICLPVLLASFFLLSCEKDEPDKTASMSGLWIQEKITVDGVEMVLPDDAKSLSLLIEPNGVYRTYAKDATDKEHFGAWTITDNTWLEITADTWRLNANPLTQTPANQWAKNHVLTRFTVLNVSDSRLEIRLKTYEGEKKYSALFVEESRPLITGDNLDKINEEYKTLKTYIYTFGKEQTN
ncbi:MAG: hypothetical protein LBR97_06580 [Dysgonamonadaceae bacterium]|jgi:hypothetical protein|nr:hypothetical protein [Dysgonamonadaceae bacterium]